MWLISKHGFLSIVQHRDDCHKLIVRGRAKEDVLHAARIYFRANPMSEHDDLRLANSAVQETPDADYRYRFEADANLFEAVVLELLRSVTYPNFKNEVARVQGYERAAIYSKVWTDLLPIDTRECRGFFRDPDTIDLFEDEEGEI